MEDKKYDRKRMYLEYFSKINHFPLIEEMAVHFSLTVEELLIDFISLDLVVYYLNFYRKMSLFLRRMSFYMPYITKNLCICSRTDLSNYTDIKYHIVLSDCTEMSNRFGIQFNVSGVTQREEFCAKLGIKIKDNGDIILSENGELLREHVYYSDIPFEVMSSFYRFGYYLRENIEDIFDSVNTINEYSNIGFDITDIQMSKDKEIEEIQSSKNKEIEELTKSKDETIETLNNLLSDAKKSAEKLQKEKEEVERKLRAEQYDNLIIKFGYLPSITEICSLCNFSPSLVREDMKILDLTPSTPYDDEKRLMEEKIKKLALDNREYLFDNYFNAEEPISISKIAMELKLCESTIANMIGYLESEIGLEIKNKIHENAIKFSDQFDNNRNAKKKRELTKAEVVVTETNKKILKDGNGKPLRGAEQRRKYYEENFFNTTSDNYKCPEVMAEEQGIKASTVYTDIKYLRNVYNYETPEWFQKDKNVMPIKVDGIVYSSKYEFVDLHYFSSFKPLNMSDIAQKMGISEMSLFNMITTMKNIGYSRIKGPAEDGNYKNTSFKVRKKNYDLFFRKNPSVKNLSDLSKVLCLPINTVRDDFTLRNLYSIYTVDSEKENNAQEQKLYLERLDKYREYFNENKSVKSLKELADNLKMRLTTIRGDFNRFNLYSEFEVEKKDSLFNEV